MANMAEKSAITIETTTTTSSDDEAAQDAHLYGSSGNDVHDMHRMGKTQELKRSFRYLSIISFVIILQSTWESILLAFQYGLTNGGTAGVIWLTLLVILGALCMIASFAEMASMAPTAGGQYHWVSEFAPKSWQKGMSYLVGWTAGLGWVTGVPSAAQLTSTLVQGLVLLRNPEAEVADLWQTTLFIMAFIVVCGAFNVFCARALPLTELIFTVVHLVGFFAFLAVLWATSEHAPASVVFTQFEDYGGWGNKGLSTLVGITTPLWCFLGPDAGAHMSEELKNSARVLPSAMMWGSVLNAVLGFVMLVTLCFCLGPDWQDGVLGLGETPTQTGIPIVEVMYRSTGSITATSILVTVLILLSAIGTVTVIATSSRQVWAFARDGGLPYSRIIRHVRPGWAIPVNAILIILLISLLVTALNFGSDVALGAIISLSNAGLLFSYILSIGSVRLKRWRGEELLPRPWSLGRWGALINDIALLFLLISFVMTFFPETPMPGAEGMNWAIVIFAFVIAVASLNYVLGARKKYVAPLMLVKHE